MAGFRAQGAFQGARLEIRDLLTTSAQQPDTLDPGRRISRQENHLRYFVVALVAALQMYISERLEEVADNLGKSWDELTEIQKRYVAVHMRRRIAEIIDAVSENDLSAIDRVEDLRRDLDECHTWYSDPTILARSTHRHNLQGLLKDNGSKAIDKAISQLRPHEMRFSDWLHKNHPRYRGMFDVLDTIIATRNDVAHGLLQRRITFREARQYRVLVCRLVSKIEEYLSEAASG